MLEVARYGFMDLDMGDQERDVRNLYWRLIDAWNRRDAEAMGALCAPDGQYIGFDGSTMVGPRQIAEALRSIFKDHATASYVAIIRAVLSLGPQVALVRAVAGMAPPGEERVRADRNAIQTLIATNEDGVWRIVEYQNTPAAFDGRPHERDALTAELNTELGRGRQRT
jgi:uncharacterized protein (TIGR02246 family)